MPQIKRASQKTYGREDDLQLEAAAYLSAVLPDEALWWHTPNGVRFDPAHAVQAATRFKAMGLKPGIPDIFILYNGKLFGTDAKSGTGTLTGSQKDLFPKLVRAGARIEPIFRSIEELEESLIKWEIPLKFRYSEIINQDRMKPSEALALSAIAQASASQKARRAGRVGRKGRPSNASAP